MFWVRVRLEVQGIKLPKWLQIHNMTAKSGANAATFLAALRLKSAVKVRKTQMRFRAFFSDSIFPQCTTWSHPSWLAELEPSALQAIGLRDAPSHLNRSDSGSLVFNFNPGGLRGAPFCSRSNPPPSEPALRAWRDRGIERAAGRQGLRTGMVCRGRHRPRAQSRHPPWEPPEPATGV